MAIDNASKRASATLFLVPTAIGIFPDGTIAQRDRQAASWLYGGILAAGAIGGFFARIYYDKLLAGQ